MIFYQNKTMLVGGFLCWTAENVILLNSEFQYYVTSDFAAGLIVNVTSTAVLNNITTQMEINKSSGGINTAGIFLNMSGTSYTVNNSRMSIYSNADYAPLLARYMTSVALTVNLSYMSGWVNGSNSLSQGLLVGTTVATSTLSLNNTQIWIYSWAFASIFSLGSVTTNTSATNQTLNMNISSYGYYVAANSYYYAINASGRSYNNTDINMSTSGAVTCSGCYYSIFGSFRYLFSTRIWGTMTESTLHYQMFLPYLLTSVVTSGVQINVTTYFSSASTKQYLLGYSCSGSNFTNTMINLTQQSSSYG